MAKAPSKGKEAVTKAPPKKAAKPAAPKTVKAAAKPVAAKATKPAKTSKKKVKQGDRYSCEVCGIVVSVDEACGCVEPYNIICCGQQMARK
jgi:hypothetical protein